MKDVISMIQFMVSVIGAYVGGLLGGIDGFLYALIIIVIIDYMTGVMVAFSQKKLSSEIGFKGIARKVLIFLLVCVANIIDNKLLANGSAIRTAVIFFYISNEGISILENTAKMGLPIPEKLKAVLQQLNKEDDVNG